MNPSDPYEAARELYLSSPEVERELDDDILAWARSIHGYVFSTPEFLILVSTPAQNEKQSRYHVYLMAGDMKLAVKHMFDNLPYRPCITFKRFGVMRMHSTPRLLQRLGLTTEALRARRLES